jgi:4-coumarate--CoA ligase (photoactive yellow protein activation family)
MRDHSPARLGEFITAGDLVIAHPDYWAAFVRTVPRVRPGASGVTSTAPCPASTAVGVRASGIDRFIEIYGSSETAGVGWRDDPDAPFALFPFWRAGETCAELTRLSSDGAPRRVTVPDRLDWIDERRVRPVGRSEGAVQVGGINVFPDRVRAVLCAHPGVAQAAVRLMSASEGDRLKAFIVPRPDIDRAVLDAELWHLIAQQLTVPERPKSIVFGPALPTGALGKLADWPLAGECAPPPPPEN